MRIILNIIIVIVLAGCEEDLRADANVSPESVAISNNVFGLRLYSALAERAGNLIISPFSSEMVLAMASAGARGNTASQIVRTTGLSEMSSHHPLAFKSLLSEMKQTNALGCQLVFANSVWVQTDFPLTGAFKQSIEDNFGGQLCKVDFAASPRKAEDEINSWFKAQTHGLISEMIVPGSLQSQTDLALAEAAYFKGRWTAGFKVEKTQPRAFKLDGTNSISTPMMSGVNSYGYLENTDVQVLQMFFTDPEYFSEPIPLNSNRFSMVILLPKKISELNSFERSLTAEKIDGFLSQIVVTEVAVNLPKFSIGGSFNLEPELRKMGIVDAFLEDRADFSGISTRKPLFIGAVCHSSWLHIDESGAEAAAGAFIPLTHGGTPDDVKVFNADHPFLFMIRDNRSGILLFLGRVVNPSEEIHG